MRFLPFSSASLLAAFCGLAAGLALPASAQDFSDYFDNNGSFEIGEEITFPNVPGGGSTISTQIQGWIFAKQGSTTPRWLSGDGLAQDGDAYIELNARGGAFDGANFAGVIQFTSEPPGPISHTPFTIGDLYELSFYAAGGVGNDNNLSVIAGIPGADDVILDFDIPNYTQAEFDALPGLEWQEITVEFIAPTETANLGIFVADSSTNPGLNATVYIDNFEFNRIPEPGSALLVLFSGFSLLLRRRRTIQS